MVSVKQKELSSIFQAESVKTLINLKRLLMLSFNALKASHLGNIFLYIGYVCLYICISLYVERDCG